LFICAAISSLASAQPAAPAAMNLIRPSVQAARIDASEAPVIDGDLSDPAWAKATIIDKFTQKQPNPGTEPTERTVVRIMYDENNLYISFYNYDSRPDQIVVRNMQRDGQVYTSDSVMVYLDPGRTRRNAYNFEIGASGGRTDQLELNNVQEVREWNTIFEAKARVVHFATHGLLASEAEMLGAAKAEPALLLTPPNQPSEEDDGLLTASEAALLKLDADWVVLSACNTAAGDGKTTGAEALSGLARAFFYAGARALLVSHWAVDSKATVSLITKAFDEIKADRRIGRAEALRRSMLALIGGGGRNAHPATWAPFVVVGEGAR